MKKENKKCVICGKEITDYGNSAMLITDEGVCCDECNQRIVVPARISLYLLEKDGGVLYKTSGEILVYPPKDKEYTLEELQTAVGGYVEFYPNTYPCYDIIVNEEGLLKNLEHNRSMKLIFGIDVVGDCLVVKKGKIK